ACVLPGKAPPGGTTDGPAASVGKLWAKLAGLPGGDRHLFLAVLVVDRSAGLAGGRGPGGGAFPGRTQADGGDGSGEPGYAPCSSRSDGEDGGKALLFALSGHSLAFAGDKRRRTNAFHPGQPLLLPEDF